MFGFIKDWKGPTKLLLNNLILIFKRYIYTKKFVFTGFISFIQNTKYIELNIAKQKKIEEIHYKKWFHVENLS